MSTQSQALRQAMAKATSGAELNELATELAAADRAEAVRKQAAADLDWAATATAATFAPVQTYTATVHTAASDWLGEIPEGTGDWPRRLVAEASLWYTRLAPEIIEDADEFSAQAHGAARVAAGRLGVHPAAATPSFLDYVHFLRKRAGSGLPQIQQTTDANNAPAPTPLPPDVFDNFAPPVDPVNAGTAGTETSMRAPIMSEIGGTAPTAGPGSAPVSGPDPVRAGDDAEGVDTENDQDKGALSGSMAVNHSYTLADYLRTTGAMPEMDYDDDIFGGDDPDREHDYHREEMRRRAEIPAPDDREQRRRHDFGSHYQWQRYQDAADEYGPELARQMHPLPGTPIHTGASTLDQIQQTTAPDGVTNRPTPLPDAVAYPWIISPNAENDAPPADGEMAQGMQPAATVTTGEAAYGRQAAHTHTADQWHGQEWPHAVVQPDAFNTPASTPIPPTGSAETGRTDALADRGAADTAPTYNDVSGHIPDYARSYAETYSTAPGQQPNQDIPAGMSGPPTQPARLSHLLSREDERALPDYAAGYTAGTAWKTGGAIPGFGSGHFEAGLYAGILDNPAIQQPFTDAHRNAAAADRRAGSRIARHASASAALHGHPGLPDTVGIEGPYLRLTAATSTDLDTMAPGTSADPTGNTPFNGPGRPPMLDGQYGAADPGGPPPYNGAPPYGTLAVPTGAAATTGAPVTIPDTGMTTPNRATAFRRTVQANLARAAAGAPLLTIADPEGSL